jgi:hypothetical protein
MQSLAEQRLQVHLDSSDLRSYLRDCRRRGGVTAALVEYHSEGVDRGSRVGRWPAAPQPPGIASQCRPRPLHGIAVGGWRWLLDVPVSQVAWTSVIRGEVTTRLCRHIPAQIPSSHGAMTVVAEIKS